jgi:formylglycine-generating enzyme required for sulfatase activity
MASVAGGTFEPLYATAGQKTVQVASFAIDTVAVSETDFAAFTSKNPKWKVARKLTNSRKPMTAVAWHAASAYCSARGARLPTTYEWEYVARADEKNKDAAATSPFKQRALEWAIKAKPATFVIGSGLRNVWGIRDLHGGIAEWTADFNGSTHAHNHRRHHATMTCASGTVETGDPSDYAAFMRYSLRRTLDVNTAANNVGFRCAV